LEIIKQCHQPARQNAQLATEGLLAETLGPLNKTQDAGMCRLQANLLESFRKLRGRMGSHLGEQECRGKSAARACCRLLRRSRFVLVHLDNIIPNKNNSL
jgi:hypothetical protein